MAVAQSIWSSIDITRKFSDPLSATVELEHRTTDGVGGTFRWATALSVDYKVLRVVKLTAGYSFLLQHEKGMLTAENHIINDYWQPKHRAFAAVTASYTLCGVELSWRERYQYTYRTSKDIARYLADGVTPHSYEWRPGKSSHSLRSRLQAKYAISGWHLTPYLSCECYNNLADAMRFEQWRYTAGSTYQISDHHAVDLLYRYVDKTDDDESSGHVVGVNYTFRF
jgi:opacity protein-like surface antigen